MGSFGQFVIFYGVVFGILDWVSDIIYFVTMEFKDSSFKNACLAFFLLQPVWYIFLYLVYIGSNSDIKTSKERCKKLALAPYYSLLQQFKLLASFENIHEHFQRVFIFKDNFVFLTLESCYKVQVFSEFFLQTLPQLIIQTQNSNSVGWSGIAIWSLLMQVAVLIKDATLISVYLIRKFIENKPNPLIRPNSKSNNLGRIARDIGFNFKNYLQHANEDNIDGEGNTSIHQLTKGEDLLLLEQHMADSPYMLFMLNHNGYTPLDMSIQEKDDARTQLIIKQMHRFNPNCSLKFVNRPNRLELKFEKAYCLAIEKQNVSILDDFPPRSIKTFQVSMVQVNDYKGYKSKKQKKEDICTTPLHMACRYSNYDAVRYLVEQHEFDVNILLNERSPLYELLSTACYQDFNILNMLMRKKKVAINSGDQLPLNQAILRGNPLIIKTMIDFGNPNPYVKDKNGKYYIHVAAAKLDIDTMQELINRGADPMTPDKVGNTILHMLCIGAIRDIEYDFAKVLILRFGMRLTRNHDNKSPLNLLRKYRVQPVSQRNQPNFKRKLQEFVEKHLQENPDFEDSDKNEDIHEAIIRGSLDSIKDMLEEFKEDRQKQIDLLEKRNYEGKTSIMIAVEHERNEIFNYILDTYPEISIEKKDTLYGNMALHIACHKQDVQIVERLFKLNEKLCLAPNFLGQTAFHIVIDKRNFQMLDLFKDYRHDCLLKKDCHGESPLFIASREGDSQIFRWFSGHLDFFKARGDQNHRGMTIEHQVCLYQKFEIVDAIRPRPDTRDFYGNLPIYYSIMQNDVQMIKKYFTKGKEYFKLRNYKYETIFHIAAKYNSIDALKEIVGKSVFIEELVKKDFKGDTPIHQAAKRRSFKVLEFLVQNCTKNFLEIQNDFGLTPLEEVKEKLQLFSDTIDENIATIGTTVEGNEKVNQLKEIIGFLESFEDFITEERWNQNFETPLKVYLTKIADPNLKLFMGIEKMFEDETRLEIGEPETKV